MKTTIIENQSNSTMGFPAIMKYVGDPSFKTREREMIVCFTDKKRCFILHQKNTDYPAFYSYNFSEEQRDAWIPFKGKITIEV